MKSITSVVRAALCVAAMAAATPALAANFSNSIHIDGIASGGNYDVLTFGWGEPGSLTFTTLAGVDSVVHMQDAISGQVLGTADLTVTTNASTTAVAIHLTGVKIKVVRITSDETASDTTPRETVSLTFKTVDYTFTPVNPVGQPSGPPVTFSNVP